MKCKTIKLKYQKEEIRNQDGTFNKIMHMPVQSTCDEEMVLKTPENCSIKIYQCPVCKEIGIQ